jgi:manganese/zinc/iron transport system substrate-binding protein
MKRIIGLTIFLTLSFLNFSHAQEPIKVVTTIGQITDVVQNIGGDRVSVQGLMGAGVDPHLYKASESDVGKLADAEIIFFNGLNLEAKMGDILGKMGRTRSVVAIGEAIPKKNLLDSVDYAGHPDPHVWFDVPLWINTVQKIRDALIEYDPDHKAEYEQRSEEYLAKLEQLNQYVKSKATELMPGQRVLVTAHDAFRYFGQKYGFEVVGLQGISTESKAGTADVKKLADFISERKIKAIFVESSVPERNIRAVQEAVKARGWNVEIGGELFSDAMGDEGTFEGTYIGMITHNIDTIVGALK